MSRMAAVVLLAPHFIFPTASEMPIGIKSDSIQEMK